MSSDMSRRQPAGAEGGLKVVAADGAVEIENLTGKKQSGNDAAHHRPRVDLIEGNPACRHFRLRKPERPADGDPAMLECLDNPAAQIVADLGPATFRGKARFGEQRVQ